MSAAVRLVRAHLAAEDRHDVDAAMAAFSDDCTYAIPAQRVALRGRDAVRDHHAAMFAAFPDLEIVHMDPLDALHQIGALPTRDPFELAELLAR